MKKIALIFILFTSCSIIRSQYEYNEYGEVKTQIINRTAILTWQQKDLEDSKDALIKQLGEGMYYDIYNHCTIDKWPENINTTKEYFANETWIDKYNVWFVASIKDGYDIILRVRAKENAHMPQGYLPADGSDFYMMVFHFGLENASECRKNLKNSPEKYPEALYERNYIEVNNNNTLRPGSVELKKGLEAEKNKEYASALEWFSKSAEKGNEVGMYNMGILYYNDQTGKEYSNDDLIFDAINPGVSFQKRMDEAFKWFKKSADLNFDKAMYALGIMYKDGKGVDRNRDEAIKWLQKAANLGNTDAKTVLEEMN